MNHQDQLKIIQELQRLYPDYAVSITVNVSSMWCMGDKIETTDYRVYVQRNGDFLINECFQTLVDFLIFFNDLQNKSKSKVEILKEVAKKQVEDYKAKNRIKDL